MVSIFDYIDYRNYLGDFFNHPYSIYNLAWLIGMARGCMNLYSTVVKAKNNPVNGLAFGGVPSVMNDQFGGVIWDQFSINVINYYGREKFNGPELYLKVFPPQMGIKALTPDGNSVTNANVNLYGVEWYELKLDSLPFVNGATDSNGEFIFDNNPYVSVNPDSLKYSNFLIEVAKNNDTVYSWMPVYDIGNVWFLNNDTTYIKVVKGKF